MAGGRLTSLKGGNHELFHKLASFASPDHWIGHYRSEAAGGNVILSDGRQKLLESDATYSPGAFDRTACPTCHCGRILATGDITFSDCLERRHFVCEYKGGPSCPTGMFSLYGKCIGVVKNTIADTPVHENCYFQSGSQHQYRLALLENNQVYLDLIAQFLDSNGLQGHFVMTANAAALGIQLFNFQSVL